MSSPIILFVDDERNILKALQRLFLDEPYEIVTAVSGEEALKLIDDGLKPTVIVSDQRMPQMSGAQLLARAKELLPDSIRMVLTGYADINAALEAVNTGEVYRYFLKPWNDDDLKMTIHSAVERFNLLEENRRLTQDLSEKNEALAKLNRELENIVEERTRQLQQKVKELEGRNTIQQHLLQVQPLSELLPTVLEIIVEVCGLEGAAFYLTSEQDGLDKSACFQLDDPSTEVDAQNVIMEKVQAMVATKSETAHILDDGGSHWGLFPVRIKSFYFGVLVVKQRSSKTLADADLQTIAGFACQAAIGINDCRLQGDFSEIEASLDMVLADLVKT